MNFKNSFYTYKFGQTRPISQQPTRFNQHRHSKPSNKSEPFIHKIHILINHFLFISSQSLIVLSTPLSRTLSRVHLFPAIQNVFLTDFFTDTTQIDYLFQFLMKIDSISMGWVTIMKIRLRISPASQSTASLGRFSTLWSSSDLSHQLLFDFYQKP